MVIKASRILYVMINYQRLAQFDRMGYDGAEYGKKHYNAKEQLRTISSRGMFGTVIYARNQVIQIHLNIPL